MSNRIYQQNRLGFWDDFSFDFDMPDFDFDFDLPDFDFPSFDFDFDSSWFGGDEIPADAFAGQYIDGGAVPDFDLNSLFDNIGAEFNSGGFDFSNTFSDVDSMISSGDVGIFNSTGTPPILDEGGSIVDGAGASTGLKLDSLLKMGKELFPVIKTAAGLLFSYEKSTNPQTGRSQYTPKQISQAQAAQMLAAQQAQLQSAQQYQQQLQLSGGGLQKYALPIILGVSAVALIFILNSSRGK